MRSLVSRIQTRWSRIELRRALHRLSAPLEPSSSPHGGARIIGGPPLRLEIRVPAGSRLSDFPRWLPIGARRGSRFAAGFTPLQPKPLGSIIDLERARNCEPGELDSVWKDYHLGRGHIGLSMKPKLYHLLENRSNTCRHFVIPLWKGNGYATMFVQVQMPHVIITGLEDYKARGTQASPYLTVTYYKDFADSKDIVLVRGDVVFASKLSDSVASWLVETAQSFYLDDTRYKLVEKFNKETRDFEFGDVLRALQMPAM